MIPYWLLFGYFAAGAISKPPQVRGFASNRYPLLVAGALLMALMVGFRYEVGADWPNYEVMFHYAAYQNLGAVTAIGDPGYQLLNWIAQKLGAEIWFVNLLCGIIFSWGLVEFAKTQRSPWLVIVVAVPYLVIVVAMGYTRQAVAIGILMAGLSSRFEGGSLLRFGVYVAVAALFHRTAVVAFPLVALAGERNRLVNFLAAAIGGYILYYLFLAEATEAFVQNYIEAAYGSEGAAIRVGMNVVPAVIFLLYQKRFNLAEGERLVWRNFSLAALGLLVLLFVLPSSTAVDRVALYILPLQLAVLPQLGGIFTSWRFGAALVIIYSFAVQLTWLNFASHAPYWVPYKVHPEIAENL